MNLYGIAAAATSAVLPPVAASWSKSNGYTKTADFKQVSAYAAPVTINVKMQALQAKELEHLENLNIQGVLRALYVPDVVQGVSRPDQTGGDLFVINGKTWRVVQIIEAWPDWTRVAVCQQ